MIVRTYRCARCKRRLRVELRAEQWADPPPACPWCATAVEQEFVPFGVLGTATQARNIAEASAIVASTIPKIEVTAADVQKITVAAARMREDITEHRIEAPAPRPAPSNMSPAVKGQILSSMAFGRQYRAEHGVSPLASVRDAMKRGDIPDPRRKVIR